MAKPIRHSLPHDVRMRGHGVFNRVFAEGRGIRRGQIVVKYCYSDDGQPATVGFVVRRNAGSAVRRNRLRRLLREAYRLQRHRFEAALPDGSSLLLVVLWTGTPQQALRPDFQSVSSDLEAALRKLIRTLQEANNGTTTT